MALSRAAYRAACRASKLPAQPNSKRLLHESSMRYSVTNFNMPAMSPTMTEGGIASWKKKEGESFAQGDILLEIETDKATIDVEASDDGVMGKILVPDGTRNIPVGKIIALLAEEGDDISNLEAPKEEAAPPPKQSTSTPPPLQSIPQQQTSPPDPLSHTLPEHSRPLFPSVHRLLLENNITKPDTIKGTGVRGMLTKGDVLSYLGKASSPLGSFKPSPTPIEEATKLLSKTPSVAESVPLDGPALRRLIVSSLLNASLKATNKVPAHIKNADFDSIIEDYIHASPQKSIPPVFAPSKDAEKYLDGLY